MFFKEKRSNYKSVFNEVENNALSVQENQSRVQEMS